METLGIVIGTVITVLIIQFAYRKWQRHNPKPLVFGFEPQGHLESLVNELSGLRESAMEKSLNGDSHRSWRTLKAIYERTSGIIRSDGESLDIYLAPYSALNLVEWPEGRPKNKEYLRWSASQWLNRQKQVPASLALNIVSRKK